MIAVLGRPPITGRRWQDDSSDTSSGYVRIQNHKPGVPNQLDAAGRMNGATWMDDLEKLLGQAVFRLWPHLPRDIQERLFEAGSSDPDVRRRLAVLLHDQHPKTAFPPEPSALA
jgi:hypothetical protein